MLLEDSAAPRIRHIETGCEIVLITTRSASDTPTLKDIHEGLEARSVLGQLVADIDFNPSAAMETLLYGDKAGRNPDDFADEYHSAFTICSPNCPPAFTCLGVGKLLLCVLLSKGAIQASYLTSRDR